MTSPAIDRAFLLPLLPEDRVGVVESIDAIAIGLSGAGVYAVKTSRGNLVLRVQTRDLDAESFAQQVIVLRRAADAGIAPAVLHVGPSARAVVSARVMGVPMASALADPSKHAAVIGSIVEKLRALHAMDSSGVSRRDPLEYARAAFEKTRDRPGFPAWAASLEPRLDVIEETLARDPRLVVSHNDVNPMNVLWDGTRAWLVDWEVTGLTHPYYDLAALALFLRLPDNVALDLVARHDGAPLTDSARGSFRALREIAGLLCGLTFLTLVDDLSVISAPTPAAAPTLGDCYHQMRAGTLSVQTSIGRASMGLALLVEAISAKG